MNDKAELLNQLKIDREPENPPTRGTRVWLLPSLFLFILLVAAGWWMSRSATAAVVTSEIALAQATRQASSVLDASGYVTARRMATVSAKVTGKVTEVMIEEGMVVTEGQVLARLDTSSVAADRNLVAAQLDAAKALLAEIEVNLNEARRRLQRTRELAGRALASEADLDSARAEVEALKARLSASGENVRVAEQSLAVQEQRLDDTIIRAPFSGVVIAKAAQPGEMISPISAGGGFTRTGICTIVDMSSLEIEVDVNEAYIQRVGTGQRVTAKLDAYPDWEIAARVVAIIPTADRQKATVRVRIGFDQLDARILPDMGVEVAFHSDPYPAAEEAQPGVLVSNAAIRRDGDSEVVFVIENGHASRRVVSTGGRVGDRLVVLSGIAAGERVITDAPKTLQHGDPVTESSS